MSAFHDLIDKAWAASPQLGAAAVRAFPVARLRYQSSFVKPGRHFRCWWPRGPLPGNVGDLLTPLIISRKFDLVPIFCPRRPFVGVGSVVQRTRAGTVVWGSGLISADAKDHPRARYLAVRGPLTRDALRARGRDVPAVYGDPAILMPLIYKPDIPVTARLGLIPHVGHLARLGKLPDDVTLVAFNVGRVEDILACIDRILGCEVIASSSLHGVILAVAYGRKFVWLRDPADPLVGDTFKFEDFFASVGLRDVKPLDWSPLDPVPRDLSRHTVDARVPEDLAPKLIDAFLGHFERTPVSA